MRARWSIGNNLVPQNLKPRVANHLQTRRAIEMTPVHLRAEKVIHVVRQISVAGDEQQIAAGLEPAIKMRQHARVLVARNVNQRVETGDRVERLRRHVERGHSLTKEERARNVLPRACELLFGEVNAGNAKAFAQPTREWHARTTTHIEYCRIGRQSAREVLQIVAKQIQIVRAPREIIARDAVITLLDQFGKIAFRGFLPNAA